VWLKLKLFIMSDLSTLKKLSRFNLCREESTSCFYYSADLICLLILRQFLLLLEWGFSGIWCCCHSGWFMHCPSFVVFWYVTPKVKNTPILTGYHVYHNAIRPHEGLNGQTPLEACPFHFCPAITYYLNQIIQTAKSFRLRFPALYWCRIQQLR
jgi:hypothetical protein